MLQRSNSTQQKKFQMTESTHVSRSAEWLHFHCDNYLAAFWATCVTLKGTCQTKQKHDPMKHLKNLTPIKPQVDEHMCDLFGVLPTEGTHKFLDLSLFNAL